MRAGIRRTAGLGARQDCGGGIDVGTRRGSVGWAEIASEAMS